MIGIVEYGALPPEVNSARIYAGPRSGPLLAAASAWDGLAAELHATAGAYHSVISDLTSEEWLGPASMSLAAAVTPFIEWMSVTAAQAERIADQATSAAAAYEAAFAEHVPPAAIAANRTRLASLVATNILGQNTPAITATEAQYGEMWAQDAVAMYHYAGASARASRPRPFTRPPQTTDPAGQARQAVATVQASSNPADSVGNKLTGISAALHQLASPLKSSASSAPGFSDLTAPNSDTSTVGISGLLNTLDGSTHDSLGTFVSAFGDTGFPASVLGGLYSAGDAGLIGPIGAGAVASAGHAAGLSSAVQAGTAPGPASVMVSTVAPSPVGGAVSAAMNRASSVGSLSVPESWPAITSANVTGPYAAALPATSAGASPEASPGMPGIPGIPGMPMAAAGERGAVLNYGMPRYGFRPSVLPKSVLG